MTLTKSLAFAVGIAAILSVLYVFSTLSRPAYASAPSGLPSVVATTSTPTVGTSASIVAATSTCAARIITTYASPIMLTFSDINGDQPSAIKGHLQAASTTVAYDSGQFGCGTVRAYGFVSTTLYVSESR